MEFALKEKLLIGLGCLLALCAGWQIATEQYVLAGLAGAGFLLLLLGWLVPLPVDAFLAGLGLVGYLVGNRGFAQFNLPGVPMLPAEAMLALGTVFMLWRGIRDRVLPVRRDALNVLLLAWLAIGLSRLRFDFGAYGFMAVRDFAMLYYAVFFFLAQHWHADPAARRWLEGCLTWGFLLGPPVFFAFTAWPDFFLEYTRVFGIPLIFVKSDVAGGLMAAGAVWFLRRAATTGHRAWLGAAALSLAGVAASNSRAALVALAAGTLWLVLVRAWRYVRPLAVLGAAGLLGLLVWPVLADTPWTDGPAYRLYESVTSIGDTRGERSYAAKDLGDKPDNNQFRLTWWRAVADETWSTHPWIGLGFGYDLADEFRSTYYAEGSEEFTARSPHNYLLTVFGRMGLLGLLPLLAFLGLLVGRTWRTGRLAAAEDPGGRGLGLWVGAWAILVSACFGVVLEGPMGAVVFWTLLGLANADGDPLEPSPVLATDTPAAEATAVSGV